MQHCMQSGLWAGEILARASLRQEKQPEKNHSNPASLYLNTHWYSATTAKAAGGVLQADTKALSQHTELQRRNKDQRRVFSR